MNWLPRLLLSRADRSDEQAMRDVQLHGDPRAFAELVRRWEKPIRRLCVRMTGDEHRGEDLTQEAFARVFASRQQFAPGRKFATWLWRIALNLCFEEGRRTRRRGEVTVEADAEAPADDAGPDKRAIDGERAALVRAAVARLPETHRAVVLLREYEGMTAREIAQVLEIPEGTVKWRMADALARLSRELTQLRPDHDEAPRQTVKAIEE
jgi:RNA polymerase sigma-70 factor (ECF subfamily)